MRVEKATNLSTGVRLMRELLERNKRRETEHITFEEGRTIIHAKDRDKIYVPSLTASQFHADKRNFVRGAMGPFGSGKSTFCMQEMVRQASEMPVWQNGRRVSRWAIVRNTVGELQSTTLKTWLSWFEDLGDIYHRQKPILTYHHQFNDGKGVIELEILFIALDRDDDVRRVKSLELTGCYINEMSEVPKSILEHMTGRVGRFPSKMQCSDPYRASIIFDTNPPDEEHWIPKLFSDPPRGYKLYKQPPALIKNIDGEWEVNQRADNIEHLPSPDYYLKLSAGKSQDFIKVFCLGEYGLVSVGKRVFQEFNPDLHAAESLVPIQGLPIHLGWDFGLNPSCVVVQLTPHGQLMVLKEYVGDGVGLRSFAESVVIPSLRLDFPYNQIGLSVGDPAGSHRNELMEEMSCIGELNSLGIETKPSNTNHIPPRLGATRYFLTRMVDGKPAFIVDKKRCPLIYRGMAKEYIYQRIAVIGEERYKEKPLKNMVSHPIDGMGYVLLELASDKIAQEKQNDKKLLDLLNPVVRV